MAKAVLSATHQTVAQEFDPAVPVAALSPHPSNVNNGDVGAICTVMDEIGFFGACLVQRGTNRIVAGKHRWLAAQQQGMATVPVLWIDADDDTAVRIMLADNRTARLGHDNETALAELLQDLAQTPRALAGTGFDGDALDELLADLSTDRPPLAGGMGAGARFVTCPACGHEFEPA